MRKAVIAIDGPAGSGKTTVARLVAQRLGLICVETGAMYRAVAWQARKLGINPDDAPALSQMTEQMDLRLEPAPDGATKVLLSGEDIGPELRAPELEQLASHISAHAGVRRKLVELQRRIAAGGGVVMEGRDIQTVVLPDAAVKVFLTASLEERARRRMKDLEALGAAADFAQVRESVQRRDERDQGRAASPLRPASDAAIIDSDNLSIDEVVDRIIALVRQVKRTSA
jgi:cytidylate kinase